jgi:hypothetical protein
LETSRGIAEKSETLLAHFENAPALGQRLISRRWLLVALLVRVVRVMVPAMPMLAAPTASLLPVFLLLLGRRRGRRWRGLWLRLLVGSDLFR